MATGRPQETPVRVGKPYRRTTLGGGGRNWPVCSASWSSCELTLPCRDEKWVRNWFTRQRSKLAARNRRRQLATTEPRTHSATVPTFKLQLCYPSAVSSGLASRRSASTPIDPTPNSPAKSHRQPSPALESRSPRPSRLTDNAEAIPRSHRSISAPVYSDSPPANTMLLPHTTTIPTYSRDPLCNRYPDFSQFFRPQGHERPHAFELSTPVDSHSHLMQLLANPNMDSQGMHFQGLSDLLNPSGLGAFPACPVAFSMRLVDLLGRP